MSDAEIIDFGSGHFVHLGLGAAAHSLPKHTGDMAWYEEYGKAHEKDGSEGRLVSLHTFSSSWDTWEMHPKGHELALCVAGRATFVQELPDGTVRKATLEAGQAVINDPGVWHTADIEEGEQASVVFVTAGEGTEIRGR